jgi:uridine kinase
VTPYVIGIAGPSCSGKTALAEGISSRFTDRETLVIPIDSYYIDLSHLPLEERALCNFDAPEAIDFDLLTTHLRVLLAGGEIVVPSYRFDTHTRGSRAEWIRCSVATGEGPRSIVIVEGLHAFHPGDLRTLIDFKIFIDTGRGTCLARRLERDVRERGRPPESILRQFEEMVVPMYEEYIAPTRRFADLVVNGEDPIDDTTEKAVEFLQRRLSCD